MYPPFKPKINTTNEFTIIFNPKTNQLNTTIYNLNIKHLD